MSEYAKSLVAAVAAVLIATITAWQLVVDDGFQLVDLLPVASAALGAVLTFVVPNVPELGTAKAWVHGALAIVTALSSFVTDHPAEVNVANLLVAGLGTLLVWYVPNLPSTTYAPAGSDGVLDVSSLQPTTGTTTPLTTSPSLVDDLDEYLAQLSTDDPVGAERTPADLAHPLPIELEAQAAAAATLTDVPGVISTPTGPATGPMPTVPGIPIPTGATAIPRT